MIAQIREGVTSAYDALLTCGPIEKAKSSAAA
jgi:hypothetical protein